MSAGGCADRKYRPRALPLDGGGLGGGDVPRAAGLDMQHRAAAALDDGAATCR